MPGTRTLQPLEFTMPQFSPRRGSFSLTARLAGSFCAAWFCLVFSTFAGAGDAPGRVGRVTASEGQVWVFAAEAVEGIAATRNRPVADGDRLTTEADGRAEVRIGSTTLRIDVDTELEVTRLDDSHFELRLNSGSVDVRLRTSAAASEFELAVREGQFRAGVPGRYRFDSDGAASRASALEGRLQFQSRDGTVRLGEGQVAEFWQEGGTQHRFGPIRGDGFAEWVAERDQRDQRVVPAPHVSPEMTGAEDLSRYGRWDQGSEYGPLWIPTDVEPGWAPYRAGQWSWVAPWGWTWIDAAPWGFAPFHYGRWVWHHNRWGWSPGQYQARPVYAPALVGWVGGGQPGRRGAAPAAGWFPLAPREVYVPGYRSSPDYLRKVNQPHAPKKINIKRLLDNPGRAADEQHYRYRNTPEAMTPGSAGVMPRQQPAAPVRLHGRDGFFSTEGPAQVQAPGAPVQRPQGGRGGVTEESGRPGHGGRDEAGRRHHGHPPPRTMSPGPGITPLRPSAPLPTSGTSPRPEDPGRQGGWRRNESPVPMPQERLPAGPQRPAPDRPHLLRDADRLLNRPGEAGRSAEPIRPPGPSPRPPAFEQPPQPERRRHDENRNGGGFTLRPVAPGQQFPSPQPQPQPRPDSRNEFRRPDEHRGGGGFTPRIPGQQPGAAAPQSPQTPPHFHGGPSRHEQQPRGEPRPEGPRR